MTSQSIALVGAACHYPEADSPGALWENLLAGRRAFRRMPPERLREEDYWSSDRTSADRTYAAEAAVIEGYEFDRVGFRVSGESFRSADLAHWLALDVAARALKDAGFEAGEGLPREATGVFLGNTLTGEFSRAGTLRLRWPYARRVVERALVDEGWSAELRHDFLNRLEPQFKAPFPAVGEESLAGGLSNTIAGRICNHFDLKGGGYTVDGACASSLLAVANACSSLAAGDLDAALAGGVDLSLDPFELVGFAKAGALAAEAMRVYDARAAGFWPGEGCGVVVLMRLADAEARGLRVVAVIRGWGVSSDGRGGITRPEVQGQLLALRRAYNRAGFGIDTVGYIEGHGTGTAVGDATELRALSLAIQEAGGSAPPIPIGSIKANIGHTKAAAGVAGLIKAASALDAQILPPTTGCEQPHPELTGDHPRLCILKKGRPWPTDRPLRAGVSAMGFGGINAHIVLESRAEARRAALTPRERSLTSSPQDAELFLIGGQDVEDLRRRIDHLLGFAHRLSASELADLSAHLAERLEGGAARAAIVASRPAEFAGALATVRGTLETRVDRIGLERLSGAWLGLGAASTRIAFLFPGQGSPATRDGGLWTRRFEEVENLYGRIQIPESGELRSTDLAQPAIVAASLAALGLLRRLGVEAELAVGHSLGELTALHWAGAFDSDALIRIATARGRIMADLPEGAGAMAGIEAGQDEVEALLGGGPAVIAGLNARRQTVVSGPSAAIDEIIIKARSLGLGATRLPVSHAFHSPMMTEAVPPLANVLAREPMATLQRDVASTVTGARLAPDVDVRGLLLRQVASPVRFLEAAAEVANGADLTIEVGPGRILAGLAAKEIEAPTVSTEAGGESLAGLLSAAGAAFALGVEIRTAPLFEGRAIRSFPFAWRPRFFANPCESAPVLETSSRHETVRSSPALPRSKEPVAPSRPESGASVLELVRARVAARAELPGWSVRDDNRMLSDLHLNSITVGQLVAELARGVDAAPPVEPLAFADATVAEIAAALEDLARSGRGRSDAAPSYQGVGPWFRAFDTVWIERSRPSRRPDGESEAWHGVVLPSEDPFAEEVRTALTQGRAGRGVVVHLAPEPDERHVGLLLRAVRILLVDPDVDRFVLVQHRGGASSFARTVQMEIPRLATRVVDVPEGDQRSAEWIVAEAEAASGPGFAEVRYDESGRRLEPALRAVSPRAEDDGFDGWLGEGDVVLVTGGGKGIAAECGLALARKTGVRLAVMGRSRPADDRALAANLERMAASGVPHHYVAADVADADAVRAAVREIESALGPVSAVVHGAGVNTPRLLGSLHEDDFARTLAPKLLGVRNVAAAVSADRLKLLATFGSIIARTGMPGEADYAVANEWLARWTERFQVEHPACRCLALEWSVWSGVGMGDRLGRIDALSRQGIAAIPPDEGVSLFLRLASAPTPAVSLVVAGRFGNPPALPIDGEELPLLRFLEHPRISYPGVELVSDAVVSTETDPYLDDHVFRGERLFPAVMGLEAMAQTAAALHGGPGRLTFENVRFDRPIVVPPGRRVAIRVAALARDPNRIDLAVRSDASAFQADHFRATCRFEAPRENRLDIAAAEDRGDDSRAVVMDPASELYGGFLFQSGRFRRVTRYRLLRSTACTAEIAGDSSSGWFGGYLPAECVLGDPGVRDAAIHAIQACIPQAVILPIGVDRIEMGGGPLSGPCVASARERSDDGDLLVYDVEIADERGIVQERWEGLRLRVVERVEPSGSWPEPLLGPYLERRMRTVVPGSRIVVEVERGDPKGHVERSDRLLRRVFGLGVSIARRPDGKPEIVGAGSDAGVSTSHARGLMLAAAGPARIACDVEACRPRPDGLWRDLLGQDRWDLAKRIASETGESEDLAATRAWAAGECLAKAGVGTGASLVLRTPVDGRTVPLASGPFTIATFVLPDRGGETPWVVGLLTRPDDACV